MKIEFPCPVSPNELIPTSKGGYCSHCSKEVINIDGLKPESVQELILKDKGVCISTTNPNSIYMAPSLRKFALSLLIVFGTSLFTFADAQVADKIDSLNEKNTIVQNGNMLQIVVLDQDGDAISSTVDVVIELPNGKELKPVLHEDRTYWLEIPLFVVGRSVVIHADRFGKKKSRKIHVSGIDEPLVEVIEFKLKKIKAPYRGYIGCPSF